MRDIATYESNFCESVEIKGIYSSMFKLVSLTKSKIQTLTGESN